MLHFGPDPSLLSSTLKVESPGELKTALLGADRVNDPVVSVLQYDLRVDGKEAPAETSNFVGWVREGKTGRPECRVLLESAMQS
jgi:hypothetical protein